MAVQAVAAHGVPVAQRKIGFGNLARVVESDEPPQNWVRKFRKIFESDEPPEFWVRKFEKIFESDEPPQKGDEPPEEKCAAKNNTQYATRNTL